MLEIDDAIRAAFVEVQDKFPALTGISSAATLCVHGGYSQILQERDGGLVEIGHFHMSRMPGCRAVIICHNVGVTEQFRHHGIGSLMQELRLRAAVLAGVQTLLCTVLETNRFQLRIMEKYGWKEMLRFTNPHTTNKVILFMREITEHATQSV